MDVIRLAQKIVVTVPVISGSKKVERMICRCLANECGGFTIVPGSGGWLDERGELVLDKVNLVYACAGPSVNLESLANKLASIIQRSLSQDCVAIEVNGTLGLYS